uniref:39S ribosomal protein L59, mitochondrial n=1 Tax=Heterorhabditis bacteriophora TaxID=37862 RepID=A0A1I7WIY6_HETBA
MKRIFNIIGKNAKDTSYQNKAVKHIEEMEKGSVKVPAPKHPTEEKYYKLAQDDYKITEDINEKHTSLIENMNKLNIKSTEPGERWISTKELPTKESEWLHRNDPVWEYGFYEPIESKIPKNKLMLREALEILRARQELSEEGVTQGAIKSREDARNVLTNHKAVKRVDSLILDDIWEYFRPFERKDHQKVVSKSDLALLQDHLKGYSDQSKLTEGVKDFKKLLKRNPSAAEKFDKLEVEDQRRLSAAIVEQRSAEHDRLVKRLKDIEEMENTIEEQKTKLKESKKIDK